MLSEVSYLRQRYPKCRVAVFTYDPKSTLIPKDWNVRYPSYFPNRLRKRFWANVGYFFRTFWEVAIADLVVVGGGGILYDNEGQSFFKQRLEWKFRVGIAKLFRKRILFWGIGVDLSEKNVKKVRSLFTSKRAFVTVRDSKSAKLLETVGISAKVVPDPAFIVPPVRSSDADIPEKVVGISIRKGYLKGELESVKSILETVRSEGFEPVFLNQSFHPGDPETDDRAYLAALAREEGVNSTRSLDESLDAYGYLGAVVAMRLHAGVLSFVNGIPFFMLSYSKKTDAFVERSGSEWVMPSAEFDPVEFSARFSAFAASLSDVPPPFFALREKCAKIKDESRTLYDETFYGLERA